MIDDDILIRIEDALLGLVADRRFGEIGLGEIAAAAGTDLATLRRAFDGKIAILESFARRIDVAVLAGGDPDGGDETHDRLFDALMRRFDRLAPHRPGLRGLERSARRDPILAAHLARIAIGAQAWMLEAAGIPTGGTIGRLRAPVLAAALARLLPVFLADEGAELPKTMAALDATLKRLAGLERRVGRVRDLCGRFGGRCRKPPATDVAEPVSPESAPRP